MKRWLKNGRGITLIELLTTVVIIGIVSAMAVPRFQKAYERIKFRSSNREIVSSLRLARSLAITNKENFGVIFEPNAKTMILFKKDVASTLPLVFETSDSLVRVDTLPIEITYVGTDISANTVMFRPNGSASFAGGGNIVTLASTEDLIGIYNVNVLASTGRVSSVGYYY